MNNNELILKIIFEQMCNATNNRAGDGLFTGKSGQIIFLYHLFQKTNDKHIKKHADSLLTEMYNSVKRKGKSGVPNFDDGLAGIGWSLNYLVENKICEGNIDDILKDIDDVIFKVLNEEDAPYYLNVLIGYLIYEISRISNKKGGNITTKINQELFIKIINKIDEVAPNEFQNIGKEYVFDLFWPFPVLILALNKALDYDIFNDKILIMIDQWMYYLNTHLPGMNCHRLSLALSLYHLNSKLMRKDIDRLIHLLLFSIDFDIFYKEVDHNLFNIQSGWYGIVFLLHHAKKIFNAGYPNYDMLEPFRRKIIDLCKAQSESEIISGFKTFMEKNIAIHYGLTSGLSGIGLLYQICPESIDC